MPHLKPVGHQSTNWMVRLVLMVATAAFTSLGTTSPPQHQPVQNQNTSVFPGHFRRPAVHHAAGHVLAWGALQCVAFEILTLQDMFSFLPMTGQDTVTRIALDHHGCRLEDGHGDLGHGQLLVVGLLRRDDRGIGGQHEVDARVRDKVGLELRDVHVQGSIETQRRSQAGDDLSDESVQVRVRGTLDVKVPEREIITIHSGGMRKVFM